MIDECLEIFLEEYEKNENLILQEFKLDLGNYYFVDYNTGEVLESLLVEKLPKGEESRAPSRVERQFKARDYLSRLLEMNKPVDGSKQIHSNNYLSFFIKKDKILALDQLKEKLLKSIDGYYNVFFDYSSKYDKKKLALLNNLKIEDPPGRDEEVSKIKNWIIDHLDSFVEMEDYRNDKSYLKIFFVPSKEALIEGSDENEADLKKYSIEAEKYIVPNIYNKNDFNAAVDNTIYGVPGDNFGLNSKKPFLLNRTKKTKVSYLVSMEKVMKQKYFFQWLHSMSDQKNYNIYIGKTLESNGVEENFIKAYPSKEYLRNSKFYGYFLRILKEKNEAEIVDFDRINGLNKEDPIYIKNHLGLEGKIKGDYYESTAVNISAAMTKMDKALYAGRLQNSFFAAEDTISNDDPDLKTTILQTRDIFVDWYVKGKGLKRIKEVENATYRLLIRHLEKNQYASLANAYNVRKSLLQYIRNNREGMGTVENNRAISKELEIRSLLMELTEEEKDQQIMDEKLFGFALGQCLYYLLSQSESHEKNHNLILPILQTKKLQRIKDLTSSLYQKYSHAISMKNKRFNRLLSMVMSYEGGENVHQQEMIIAGFASSNIIYEKKVQEESEEA